MKVSKYASASSFAAVLYSSYGLVSLVKDSYGRLMRCSMQVAVSYV